MKSHILALGALVTGALLTGCGTPAPAELDASAAFARVSLLFNS